MKRTAAILVLALSATSGFSSADAACTIKESPAKSLQEYVKNVDEILKKAVETNGKTQCNAHSEGQRNGISDAEQAQSSVVGSVNRALTAENVVTSFRYTVDLVTRSELPAGIRRDHALLDRKQKAIISTIDATYANCGAEQVMEGNASKYGSSTEGRKVGKVLESLLENNTNVMKLYREAVLGDPGTVVTVDYAPDSFIPDVMKEYGPAALAECNVSGGEGSFFDKVKGAVDRIGNLGDVMQRGTDDWKKAFALLRDPNTDVAKKREEELLRKELARQGMSTLSADRAVANLKAFNAGRGWQGLNGSAMAIGESINKGVAAVQGLYEEAKGVGDQYSLKSPGQPSPQEAKNADEYVERVKNLEEFKTDLGAEIAADYELASATISGEDSAADDTFQKLIDAHVDLTTTIGKFSPYVETSKKACQDQAGNMGGNCTGE